MKYQQHGIPVKSLIQGRHISITGLTAKKIGTTARWYSNKTPPWYWAKYFYTLFLIDLGWNWKVWQRTVDSYWDHGEEHSSNKGSNWDGEITIISIDKK